MGSPPLEAFQNRADRLLKGKTEDNWSCLRAEGCTRWPPKNPVTFWFELWIPFICILLKTCFLVLWLCFLLVHFSHKSISAFLLETCPYPLSSENSDLTATSMLMIHRSIHLPTPDLALTLQNKSLVRLPRVSLQMFCSPPTSTQLKKVLL